MDDSPIGDEALEALAERVARRFRLVRARAPKAVAKQALETLAAVHQAVHGEPPAPIAPRVALLRALETLDAELAGRSPFEPTFYRDGRLGMMRAFDPIRIRETVDDRRVRAHLERYGSRLRRAEDRMRWFYERAGFEVEEKPARPAWDQPYANLEETQELLWGSVSRS
jgi:hypothetical protein